ncbi:MAG: helix-turn-helix transcriptional regulator [Treponema sp.]|jgi:transcriptional regulator with XRE-family HTH domain|nr:helix-turn-helix transcriptional regulator [Treponema sp.]
MDRKINEQYVYQLISRNIKRIRTIQNISQLGLAQQTGLTHNFINDIENCKKGVSAKTLAKLSMALKVEPFQFFLPAEMFNKEMMSYVQDFNDSLQKVVAELTQHYLSKTLDDGKTE